MGPAAAPHVRHNYYNDEDFFRPAPTAGMTRDAYGRRVVRTAADCLAALAVALGPDADAALYEVGVRWGAADLRALASRVPGEFGVGGVEQVNFNVLLETWR